MNTDTAIPSDADIIDATLPNADLKFAFSVTHGYMHTLERHFQPGLSFTPEGLARCSSVLGWLCGLAQGGNLDLANKLASDFMGNLEYLAKYGGTREVTFNDYNGNEKTREIPAYIVKLTDDGTSHGFGLLWYRPLITPEMIARNKELGREEVFFEHSWPRVPHGYDFNGGLLYHGPGGGETFSVSLTGHRAWSVHT